MSSTDETTSLRIGLTYEAEAEDISADKIVAQVVERTPVPAK